MSNKDKTIFVTVPAYNDPSLTRTLDSALENALYPDRVFFCVAMQYDEDKMPDISKYKNNPNFNFMFYDVKQRPGVYWIRREMAEQHNGEDYFLMVDSHMIFSKYWDAKLINDYEDLRRLHGDRTIITRPTTPMVGDTMTNGLVHEVSYWKVDWDNQKESIERTILPAIKNVDWDGERYHRTLYSCSHLFFTNKNYLTDVGFFPIIRSYSEEYTIAVTSFLSGWDYYMMPEYVHIGHDDEETMKSIYGTDRYTLAQGKRYQALFESDEEKQEIAKFVFLDNSKIFKVKNQRRDIQDFYRLGDEDLQKAQQAYIAMLAL